jgi:hypothetical protein
MKSMKSILFSTPMVQSILDRRKQQTRRVIKPQPSNPDFVLWNVADSTNKKIIGKKYWASKNQIEDHKRDEVYFKPKYQVGDVLWVRETWFNDADFGEKPIFIYKADNENFPRGSSPWKPSIFMPKEAARIFLYVTSVRVERLQDISEEDAIAEGVEPVSFFGKTAHSYKNYDESTDPTIDRYYNGFPSARLSFESLWQSINGEDSWNENPLVWVYEFERIKKPSIISLKGVVKWVKALQHLNKSSL